MIKNYIFILFDTMVVNELGEIRKRVKFESSRYPLIDLTAHTLPIACQEFRHFLDNQLLDGFVYDHKKHIWKKNILNNFSYSNQKNIFKINDDIL